MLLDLKDRKILCALDRDARQSSSQIAKTVGLSSQVVGFRMQRLIERKFISWFYTVINIGKLGFTSHKNFIRLQNCDKGQEQIIIKFLVEHPNVLWVAQCDGRFDLVFATWSQDMLSLNSMLREFQQKFSQFVAERQIAPIIRGEYFSRDYLVNRKRDLGRKVWAFGGPSETVTLDLHDWQILSVLSNAARKTCVEIGVRVGLSPDAVAKRIVRLKATQVIRHFNIVPNEAVFPYLHYKILLSWKKYDERRELGFAEYCAAQPHIVYLCKVLGPWDFEIDLEVATAQEYRDIMMEIKSVFSDILREYSVLHIYQVHKYNFCPSVPEECVSELKPLRTFISHS